MNTFETRQFRLTPNSYYKVIMRLHFKKFWWLYAIILLGALVTTFDETKEPFDYFMIIVGYAYIPLISIYYYFWATSRKNKLLFAPRTVTFRENFLEIHTTEEVHSEITLRHVFKLVEQSDCLLLYIAKSQFIYIPKNAFINPNDMAVLLEAINKSQ
jgi:YcxB-like protein